MAVYGIETVPGQVAWTGWSTQLGAGDATTGSASGYVSFNGITQGDDRIAKMIRNGQAGYIMKGLLLGLLGAASGSNVTATKARVAGVTGSPGGICAIETVSYINRNTTAADVTALKALVNRNVFPSSYPADLSGNGGGGKITN